MKKYIRYIMLLTSLFMTVFQSLHILEHSFHKEQLDESSSDIHHNNCKICHYNQQFVDNDETVEIIENTATFVKKEEKTFFTIVKISDLQVYKSLRAPPYFI